MNGSANMSYILFICVTAPILSLLLVADKRTRRRIIFMLIGMFTCLFASELNGFIRDRLDTAMLYLTTSITPITEELAKSIFVFVFAIVITSDIEELFPNAFFIGIGFAVLENLVLLTQNFSQVTLVWSIIRGFSSGLMHGICTGMVGLCFSYVRKNKKMFYSGMFATFNLAVVFHAIFNSLVQSKTLVHNYIGFAMPVLVYIPMIVFIIKKRKKEAEEAAAKEQAS